MTSPESNAPPNHTRPRGRPRWTHRGRGTSPHRPLTPFVPGATRWAARPAIAPPQGYLQPAARTRAQCGSLSTVSPTPAWRPTCHPRGGGGPWQPRQNGTSRAPQWVGPPARTTVGPRWDVISPRALSVLLASRFCSPSLGRASAGWLRGHGLAGDSWPGGQRGGGVVICRGLSLVATVIQEVLRMGRNPNVG